jgi:hypothetical protein
LAARIGVDTQKVKRLDMGVCSVELLAIAQRSGATADATPICGCTRLASHARYTRNLPFSLQPIQGFELIELNA